MNKVQARREGEMQKTFYSEVVTNPADCFD